MVFKTSKNAELRNVTGNQEMGNLQSSKKKCSNLAKVTQSIDKRLQMMAVGMEFLEYH
jgi:hypothetical protein